VNSSASIERRNYWRGSEGPAIKQILFKFIPNTTRASISEERRSTPDCDVSVGQAPRSRSDSRRVGPSHAGNAYEHVTLMQRNVPAFQGRSRAPRPDVCHRSQPHRENHSRRLAPITNGPIQPVSWAFSDDTVKYGFDPDRARALLAEGRLG
jgi:ABC-type transport system substrate-binding protein